MKCVSPVGQDQGQVDDRNTTWLLNKWVRCVTLASLLRSKRSHHRYSSSIDLRCPLHMASRAGPGEAIYPCSSRGAACHPCRTANPFNFTPVSLGSLDNSCASSVLGHVYDTTDGICVIN
ncbi:hypothetical protein J6590_009700 [Homalodisca vitripennis]|nr:hypothetical protein J6590_009700 [Homalodisca vitripennis]